MSDAAVQREMVKAVELGRHAKALLESPVVTEWHRRNWISLLNYILNINPEHKNEIIRAVDQLRVFHQFYGELVRTKTNGADVYSMMYGTTPSDELPHAEARGINLVTAAVQAFERPEDIEQYQKIHEEAGEDF